MAGKFKIGDLVWAKMKGFPAWPGRVIEPKPDVKRPSNKKAQQFIFFFGSENYAWVPEETMWSYANNKEKFYPANRIPKGFKEAIEAVDDALKAMPAQEVKTSDLPSIDEELALMSGSSPASSKGSSRDSLTAKKRKHVDSAELSDQESIESSVSETSSAKEERRSGKRKRAGTAKADRTKPKEGKDGKGQKVDQIAEKLGKPTNDNIFTTLKNMEGELGIPNLEENANGDTHSDNDIFDDASSDGSREEDEEPEKKPEKKNKETTRKRQAATYAGVSKKQKLLVKFPQSPSRIQDKSNNDIHSSPTKTPVKKMPVNVPHIDSPLKGSPLKSEQVFSGPAAYKDINPSAAKIGFLGLGIMGHGMVTNLMKSGHEVTVWNRTAAKCRDFIKDGAIKGNTPAEVVNQCDITFSCVSDPSALKDLVFGNCGVLQGVTKNRGFVSMSTIDVETATDINEAVTARGGRFLEAPVLGSKDAASTGELVILAAGDSSLYMDCLSCFQAMGKKTLFQGDVGSAAKMKLVTNMLAGTVLAGLAECLALAEKVGLDQTDVLTVLDWSSMACPLISEKGNAIINSHYQPYHNLKDQQKDLRLAVNMADSVDQALHVCSSANELFKKAKAKGYGENDVAAVYRAADM